MQDLLSDHSRAKTVQMLSMRLAAQQTHHGIHIWTKCFTLSLSYCTSLAESALHAFISHKRFSVSELLITI